MFFAYAAPAAIVDVDPVVGWMQAALPVVLGIGALLVVISIAGAVVAVVTRGLTR